MTDQPDHRDEQIDAMIARTWMLARAALVNHPQRERIGEMVEQGAGLLIRPLGAGRFQLFIGFVAGYLPDGADPEEVVPLVSLPRMAIVGGLDDADREA